eukprot:m.418704 g.418704  ORF g.418704 m.418704 type:complete len:139 (-) comp56625_c1_seq6:2587-3003(-)
MGNFLVNLQVPRTDDGLEALIFTAQGDMRQAVNNLQSTYSGFSMVNSANVFKVCDQPHPLLVKSMIENCLRGNVDAAYDGMHELWSMGYAAVDIASTVFRVVKTFDMAEYLKLEYIKVCTLATVTPRHAALHSFRAVR